MSNGEISSDLGMPTLAPTPAVRGVSKDHPSQDPGGQGRRRAPAQPSSPEDSATETSDEAQHQLDRMA